MDSMRQRRHACTGAQTVWRQNFSLPHQQPFSYRLGSNKNIFTTQSSLDYLGAKVHWLVSTSVVEFQSVVTDLSIELDNQRSMDKQVSVISKSCFYNFRQLRVIKRSLTRDTLEELVQVFVHCRLEYCYSSSFLCNYTVIGRSSR